MWEEQTPAAESPPARETVTTTRRQLLAVGGARQACTHAHAMYNMSECLAAQSQRRLCAWLTVRGGDQRAPQVGIAQVATMTSTEHVRCDICGEQLRPCRPCACHAAGEVPCRAAWVGSRLSRSTGMELFAGSPVRLWVGTGYGESQPADSDRTPPPDPRES